MKLIKKILKKILTVKMFNTFKSFYWKFIYNFYQRLKWFYRKEKDQSACLVYWNDMQNPHRIELIERIAAEANLFVNKTLKPMKIFEYGSYCGINLRMLQDKCKSSNIQILALEPNKEAYHFMVSRLNLLFSINGAEKELLKNLPVLKSYGIELTFVNAVFYSMSYNQVCNVINTISNFSNKIIISEIIENIDGEKTIVEPYKTRDGDMVYTAMHPYRLILKKAGFSIENVYNFPEELKTNAVTGIITAIK